MIVDKFGGAVEPLPRKQKIRSNRISNQTIWAGRQLEFSVAIFNVYGPKAIWDAKGLDFSQIGLIRSALINPLNFSSCLRANHYNI